MNNSIPKSTLVTPTPCSGSSLRYTLWPNFFWSLIDASTQWPNLTHRFSMVLESGFTGTRYIFFSHKLDSSFFYLCRIVLEVLVEWFKGSLLSCKFLIESRAKNPHLVTEMALNLDWLSNKTHPTPQLIRSITSRQFRQIFSFSSSCSMHYSKTEQSIH